MNISILLVKPQLGENIGAVARAMANFGIRNLRIIAPREEWPNQKAISNACKARDILDTAKIYSNLSHALSDIQILYASSARSRDLVKEYIAPRDIDLNTDLNIGIMFGCESSGLSNEELIIADKIICINTNNKCQSINLSHAVAIICYEISHSFVELKNVGYKKNLDRATKEELILMYEHLEEKLELNDFFRVQEKKATMMNNIKAMLGRQELTSQEVNTMRGIIRALSKSDSS